MNTKIIMVEDDPGWAASHCKKIEDELQKNDFPEPKTYWVNPHDYPEDDQLAAHIEAKAGKENWDAIIVDINLGRSGVNKAAEGIPALLLPFKIITAFRKYNRSGLALIYSGSIEEHLRDLFQAMGGDPKKPEIRVIEGHIRQVLLKEVSGFFSRDNVISDLVGDLRNAPWDLKIERKLRETPNLTVEANYLSDAVPMSFENVADSIRAGNALGNKALSVIAKHGISAIADIFG